MTDPGPLSTATSPRPWVTRTVVGILLATFFSDVGHEMATAVLPLYLGAIGLGPAALGLIEGAADLLFSLSKLGGGILGHHLERKRPWASLGYLVTSLGVGAMGLVHGLAGLVSLRAAAWAGRGFRSPLRDFILSDAVEPTHFGRAYGLERALDMLGAVAGPLVATVLVWAGVDFRHVILWSVIPSLVSAWAIVSMVKERGSTPVRSEGKSGTNARPPFPKAFWLFLIGVFLFGLGDFSRTFLILLASQGRSGGGGLAQGSISIPVLLYTLHNLASAGAAYPIGRWGDRASKMRLLVGGYALGVGTNLLLACLGRSPSWLVVAIILSGIYIAAEEVLEKAAAAQLLPRELRSLGFGILACANALGDMVSSLYVGGLLQKGMHARAFGIAAGVGILGVVWLTILLGRLDPLPSVQSTPSTRLG